MINYGRLLNRAASEAERLANRAQQWQLSADHPFVGLQDDDQVVINTVNEREPNCIYLESTDEFIPLYDEIARRRSSTASAGYGHAVKEHEEQHIEVAHLLSQAQGTRPNIPQEVTIGLRVTYDPRTEFFNTVPFVNAIRFRTTKLGLAILSAYPSGDGGPSPGDINSFTTLGYSDVASIARLAIVRELPVPLTHQKI